MMHNMDRTDDGHLGAEDCFTFNDGIVPFTPTASIRSSADVLAGNVSGENLPAVAKDVEEVERAEGDTVEGRKRLFSLLELRWVDKKTEVQPTRDEVSLQQILKELENCRQRVIHL